MKARVFQVLALLLLGLQMTYAQDTFAYRGTDNEIYRGIIIDPLDFGQGIICGADGNKIAGFHAAIRLWIFDKEGTQTFFDKNKKPLAQLRYENNQANLYNPAGELVHTFAIRTSPRYSPKNYIVALTKSDDIVMLNPKTHEIVDSYNFRVLHLATKVPQATGFSSLGSFVQIVYDAKGNYTQTLALKSEFDAPSAVTKNNSLCTTIAQLTSLP